jgi:hypothetical protein
MILKLLLPLVASTLLQPPAVPTVTFANTTVSAKPGRIVQIQATTNGKVIEWFKTIDDCDLIIVDNGRTAIFSALTPGKYNLHAYTAIGDVPSKLATCVVVVGDKPDDNNDNKPKPDDNKPKPDDITKDPLFAPLQSIYGALGDNKKSVYKSALAGVYRQAIVAADSQDYTSPSQVYNAITEISGKVLHQDDLRAIRERLATELDENIAVQPREQLTPESRKKMVAYFTRIANILENLK